MSTCKGCGGVVGRDCYNPQECEWISRDQQARALAQQYAQPDDARINALEAEVTELREAIATLSAAPLAVPQRPIDDELWDATMRDRDTYHEWADRLAEAISQHFDAHIGEHSNMNCPWAEALQVIEMADPDPLAVPLPACTCPSGDGSLCFPCPAHPAVPLPADQGEAILHDALTRIKGMTDADDPESYRCDDREGCLDTVFSVASRALSATPLPLPAGPSDWQPMATAPKDGTMLCLMVDFLDNATEDSREACATIGANSFDHTNIDQWQFAGWNWQQDCFTEGVGTPVSWMPLAAAPVIPPAAPSEPTVTASDIGKTAMGLIRELTSDEDSDELDVAYLDGTARGIGHLHAELLKLIESRALPGSAPAQTGDAQ